jgi:hypothetical protein
MFQPLVFFSSITQAHVLPVNGQPSSSFGSTLHMPQNHIKRSPSCVCVTLNCSMKSRFLILNSLSQRLVTRFTNRNIIKHGFVGEFKGDRVTALSCWVIPWFICHVCCLGEEVGLAKKRVDWHYKRENMAVKSTLSSFA